MSEKEKEPRFPVIKCPETGLDELDIGDLPDDDEKGRLVGIVRDMIGAVQLGPDELKGVNVNGVGGLMAKMKEMLTGFVVVGKVSSGSAPRGFCAWNGICASISQSLWNDTNFSNAVMDTVLFVSRVMEGTCVREWLSVDGFVDGVRVVLGDMYDLRRKLHGGEAYAQYGCLQGLQKAFCKERGLPLINVQIEVLEFLLQASRGGALDYVPSASSLLPKELTEAGRTVPVIEEGDCVVNYESRMTQLRAMLAGLEVGEVREIPDEFLRLERVEDGRRTVQVISSLDDLPTFFNPDVERAFNEAVRFIAEVVGRTGTVQVDAEFFEFLNRTAEAKGTRLSNVLCLLLNKALIVREDGVVRFATDAEVSHALGLK